MSARVAADDLLAEARQMLLSGAPEDVESLLCLFAPEDPGYADALHIRGLALGVVERIDEALPLLEEAHQLRPEDIEIASNLARALGRAGHCREALLLNDRLLCAGHRSTERFCDCGILLLRIGQHAEALAFFNLAIEADPDAAIGWAGKATLMQRYRALEDALLCHDRAILLAPHNAVYRSGRASVLTDLARYGEAMHEHGLALALEPLSAPLWLNRGITLTRCNRPEEALLSIARAHELAPPDTQSLCSQGDALYELKRFDEARQCYEEALRLDPECHDAAVKRGWLMTSFGNYREGWREIERRLVNMLPLLRRHQHLPRWTGDQSLAGKRIVVWSEQGHGDVIQYCRFALDVLALGAEVVLEVKSPLVELCASMPGCQVIALNAPLPPCDFQISVASLPQAIAIAIDCDTVPHAAGYLHAPAEAVQRWLAKLPPARHALRVGIACSGFVGHSRNSIRSIPLRHFLPMAKYADLFLLQPALGPEDEKFQQLHPEEIQRPHINAGSFADTAGLVQNMDLVISVDTSIAHLSASLGKETWLLLDWVAEWRWMHDIAYSPWYQSMRLFRQKARADWTSVVIDVLRALSERQQA
ncbi:tetratricopeptide repeat protein [Noviherbaspirillum pedocola]|uniref:Tetratricopeptide repeat protein n=1 Tax=Noviherbaspirillum pedocola TaxID=2801341 RepID=A0A934SPQ6_9BURK|nr:tetratricopeptide repeat protein [Noviherbaspirillum pedocola]MBK4733220.1 tetratricopeptide repeat protein [Noviherbaspirillum pedocola]